MTNKKKIGAKRERRDADPVAMTRQQQQSIPSVKPGIFSSGQFTFLILVSIGVSRIMQVRSAYGNTGSGVDAAESSTTSGNTVKSFATCVEHLGEMACSDSNIQSLLKLKFHSALQLTALACSMAFQCWNSEAILQHLNSLFVIAPMAAGVAVMAQAETISQALVWRQALVCVVLAVLAAPRGPAFPFMEKRTNRVKSLSSMALAGLTLSNGFRAVHFVMLTTSALTSTTATPSNTSSLFVINPMLYSELPSDIAKAAHPIVLFLAVDGLTATLVYALSWYYLPDRHQRTLLLLTASIKLAEYFLELPLYANDTLFSTETIQTTVLTLAFVSGVGWIAPPISFKKKLG